MFYHHCLSLKGCEWVAENAVHPAAASMSLGGTGSESVDNAVRAMINAGVSVSVSGGNDDFSSCNKSPARTAEVCNPTIYSLNSISIQLKGKKSYQLHTNFYSEI